MSTELDCYGMTPEERAEFESQYVSTPMADALGKYTYIDHHEAAGTWAACAKLYRTSNEAQREQIEKQAATIKELDAKNAALHTETNHLRLNLEGRSSSEFSLTQSLERADARIKELEAENKQAWGEYNNAQHEAKEWRVGQMALIAENLKLKKEVSKLSDEIERLRADAARYAFLRDNASNSLHLTRNGDHACNYMTAKQWIEEAPTEDWIDVPAIELEKMKESNTIWALQIYPNTPVGFNVWNGASLDFVVDAAMKGGE